MAKKHVAAGRWADLSAVLSDSVIAAAGCLGHAAMTPVQANTIPLLLKSKDVVVEAVTGSGKTLAFAIPIVEKCFKLARESRKGNASSERRDVVALVISPTRELAKQIHDVVSQLIKNLNDSDPVTLCLPMPQLLTGGNVKVVLDLQIAKQEKPQVLIGTPGRMAEFIPAAVASAALKFANLEMLIVDEADRMLNTSTLPDLRTIVSYLPKQRRTGLFSATMTDVLLEGRGHLGVFGLRNPVRVVVKVQSIDKVDSTDQAQSNEQRIPSTLDIGYTTVFPGTKLLQLYRLLSKESTSSKGARKTMVFVSTCAEVDYLYKLLSSEHPLFEGWRTYSLHGQMPPSKRAATLDSYKQSQSSKPAVLLTTDVSARGLDLEDIDLVVQFDAPTDPSAFAHRCGRTARAGRKGQAIVYLTQGPEEGFVDLMRIRKVPMRNLRALNESDLSDASVLSKKSDIYCSEAGVCQEQETEDPLHARFVREIRGIVSRDRALSELGARAFVSFIKSYSKHEASYIFRVQDLVPDLGLIARGLGLLRLPAMPEIRLADARRTSADVHTPHQEDDEGSQSSVKDLILRTFQQDLDRGFDWNTYSYADPRKEAARKIQAKLSKPDDVALEHKIDSGHPSLSKTELLGLRSKKRGAPVAESWSVQADRKARKLKRQEHKKRKQNWRNRVALEGQAM